MPVTVQCRNFVLSTSQVESLWSNVISCQEHGDDVVTVRCVSKEEIQRINREHRGVDRPTNVLTFSYLSPSTSSTSSGQASEHDVALCLSVAGEEAQVRKVLLKDYVALLLVHAFLHATGMDHERSPDAAQVMEGAEQIILQRSGFRVDSL